MAKQPRPLIAGNWKMNGLKKGAQKEINALIRRFTKVKPAKCDVLICPPATLLGTFSSEQKRSGVFFGGQDCHENVSGSHTGDISAEMLKDTGCKYVIVGHSERRADHGETSKLVRQKAAAAIAAGLVVIICVGETAKERKAKQTLKVVGDQLRFSLPQTATAKNTVIAYEPVWAIGSGLTPTRDDVANVHKSIRGRLNRRFKADGQAMRILYGGSVKSSNAAELMAVANVDGALVGGASLTAKDFWPIVEAKLG